MVFHISRTSRRKRALDPSSAGPFAARRQQVDDGAMAIERALALHLGRVRGQHRLDARPLEERDDLLGRHVGGAQPLQRDGDAPLLRLHAARVQILGRVRQVMEIAERAHDAGRVRRTQPPDRPFQLLEAGRILLLPVVDRGPADALDQIEDIAARLLADRVTEQPPEEPDVLAQRRVAVLVL